MIEHFREYNDIISSIEVALMQIRGLKEAMTLKGISYSAMPKSNGANVDIAFYLGEIEEIEQRIEELKVEKNILKKKHENEIDRLSDSRYKIIVRMIYLDNLSIDKVADVLNLSISHTKKLKSNAVEEFLRLNNKN